MPFLWILPLTLYLLSFVLCFESDRWYRRSAWVPLLFASFAACGYGLIDFHIGMDLKVAIPLYCAGLFIGCMVMHGELAGLRPAPQHLTRFYLALSLGGALGGALVGLLAPRVLPSFYELGIGFVLIALLVAIRVRERPLLSVAALLIAVFLAITLANQVRNELSSARLLERNFYGRLLVRDVHVDGTVVRRLLHGAILHGEEFLSGPHQNRPTTYYGATSGVGRVLMATAGSPRRVGVIGLGTGTLAAYGQPGDLFRFYDIDPAVIAVARQEFGYLRNSRAHVDIVLGDARLNLEKEAPNRFDLLVVDAFSGDSIPVHLMTREALAIYRTHINGKGVIAFHVSNRFLSLAPVVAKLAEDQGMQAMLVADDRPAEPAARSDWVLVASSKSPLIRPGLAEALQRPPEIQGLQVWTDDSNNLFKVVK